MLSTPSISEHLVSISVSGRSVLHPIHHYKRGVFTGLLIIQTFLACCLSVQTVKAMQEPDQITLAANGKTSYVIAIATDCSPAEQHAAAELAHFLKEVTGAEFLLVPPEGRGNRPAIAVGPGAARRLVPNLDLSNLGTEGIVIESRRPHLILTGGPGAARGTLYAVATFLEDTVGCRWWTAKESDIPRRVTLVIPDLKQRYVPTVEYRYPFVYEAFDPDWMVRNKCNGNGCVYSKPLDETRGGGIGPFLFGESHTFHTLLPDAADKFFPHYPEWFAEINGERSRSSIPCDLCLTNPDLLAYVIGQVRAAMRTATPDAIINVSQDDGSHPCHCVKCRAVEREEGSTSGSLVRFVNAVADAIKDDYPHAAVISLAYEHSRKPPRLTKPRPNVIIWLSSFGCSYAHPLDHEKNRAFMEDLRGWAAVCDRIYIWDYSTNFSHYLSPFPNLRVLGPNVRLFAQYRVKGFFEQGSYASAGGEFAALRAWVIAKLLWNPAVDERALIQQFVKGYYGAAAPYIVEYQRLLHDTAEKADYFLIFNAPLDTPYLTLDVLTQAEALFEKAEAAVWDRPDLRQRVQLVHAGIQYVVLNSWLRLKQEARVKGRPWPFGATPHDLMNSLLERCRANGVALLGEGGPSPEDFMRKYEQPFVPYVGVAPPPMCKDLPVTDWVDFQEDVFNQVFKPEQYELRPDRAASNGKAFWMSANHVDWAAQCYLPAALWKNEAEEEWTVYAVIRVEKKSKGDGTAFSYGLYDLGQRKDIANRCVSLAEIRDDSYHVYPVATINWGESRYIWVAPTANRNNVAGIWVDRVFMVRQSPATKQ